MHRHPVAGRAAALGLVLALARLIGAAETAPGWDPLRGPDDAIAYVIFARPAATLAAAGAWARALNGDRQEAGEEMTEGIASDIEERLGFRPDFEKPIVLAAFSPMSRPDPVIAAVPADAKAEPPEGVRRAAGFWLWSRTAAGLDGIAKPFASPAGWPADADIVVHARVAQAYPTIVPILRMQVAMFAGMLESQEQAGPEVEMLRSAIEDLLDVLEEVDAADGVVRFAADGIRFTKTLRAKPDTPLAGFAARHAGARADLGQALPPAAFRFAAGSPDLIRLAGRFLAEALDAVDAGDPERAAILKAFDAAGAFLGGEIALTMAKGPAGKAQILAAAAAKDSAALRDAGEKLARDPGLAKALKAADEAVASFLGTAPEWTLAYPRGFVAAGAGDGAAAALAALAAKLAESTGPAGNVSRSGPGAGSAAAAPAPAAAPPAAAFRLDIDLPTTLALAGGPALLDVMGFSMAPYLRPAPPISVSLRFAPGVIVADGDLPIENFRNVTDAFRAAIDKGIAGMAKGLDESTKRLDEAMKEMERKRTPEARKDWTLDLIGRPAAEIKGKTADGGEIALSSLRGKVVILDVWATWCPPCRAEIPGFIDLQKTYGEKGLAILGVTAEPASVVKPFVEKQKMNYPTIVEAEELPAPYDRIEGIPTTFVIDRQGRIVAVHVGYQEKAVFEEEIEPLLEGK